MGNDGFGHDGDSFASGEPGRQEPLDELERQAREALRTVRESAGDLGTRVRQMLSWATDVWEETHPAGQPRSVEPSQVPPADAARARALARRWVAVDFLVEPELPAYMSIAAVRDAALWRVEVRERGETRTITAATEPYRGVPPDGPGPVLPAWDYVFTVPEIEAGERRERLHGTGMLVACPECQGSAHRQCATCGGHGFVQCAACHGRARIPCRRCRGRGRIADPVAERRARASKGYWQVQAERLANDAALRLADFAEQLRQEHGVPLPPSAQWAPLAPASGETIPCPDCRDGSVPCPTCTNGKLPCEVCAGSGLAPCGACGATGRVVRFDEVVRRFDTQIQQRVLPLDLPEAVGWMDAHVFRRCAGETVWQGTTDLAGAAAPADVPQPIWAAARALVHETPPALPHATVPAAERHVLSRQLRFVRVPLTRVEYSFGGYPFAFTAAGTREAERFAATEFPPRWHRVGRFLRALARDVSDEGAWRTSHTGNDEISTLAEYRLHRMRNQAQRVRIIMDDSAAPNASTGASAGPQVSAENPRPAEADAGSGEDDAEP